MRVIVFFDLPSVSNEEKAEYRKFRKHLIKSGFIMLQESVYSKLVLNGTVAKSVNANLKKNKPKSGLVQILTVTEKQYNSMEYIIGERRTDILDNDSRLVVI